MHAQTNSIMQDNLNGILAEVSNLLKQKLDVLFAELLTKSDEYDETNRILLTLPIIKNIINKTTVAVEPIANTNESSSPRQKPIPLFEQTCTFNYDSLLLFDKGTETCAHTIAIDEITQQDPETSEPVIENISLNIEEVESDKDEEVVEVEQDEENEEDYEEDEEDEDDNEGDEEDVDNEEEDAEVTTCAEVTTTKTLQEHIIKCMDTVAYISRGMDDILASKYQEEDTETIATQSDDGEEEEEVEVEEVEVEEEGEEVELEEEGEEVEVEEEEVEVVEEVVEEEEVEVVEVEEEEAEEDDQDEIETIATQSCADEEEEKDDEDLEDGEGDGDGEEEEEEENEEVFEITIKNKTYFTTSETNGIIYESDASGDPGDEIGVFKNGIPHFN